MRFGFLSLTAAAWLGACATADEIYLPDGRLAYNMSCGGMSSGMGDCLQKAGDLCETRGYYLYTADGYALPFGFSGDVPYDPYGGVVYTKTTGAFGLRDLIVACR